MTTTAILAMRTRHLAMISIAVSVVSVSASMLSLKARDISAWYSSREQATVQSFVDPHAGDDAIAWSKAQNVRVEVVPGLTARWWTVLAGVGAPKATCEIRIWAKPGQAFSISFGESTNGAARIACGRALKHYVTGMPDLRA